MAAPANHHDEPVAPPPPDADAKVLTTVTESDAKLTPADVKDIALAKLDYEKKLSFIKAWEDSEKAKADNRAQKRQSKITSWENSKKASLELQLKKMQEQLERKKAKLGEKIKNKEALIHKQAEEKRAVVEARKGEELLQTEETAAKYRASGQVPKSGFKIFGIDL
ncbi:hypothetical protein ACS0TY_002475 [Phlomoides rotata]